MTKKALLAGLALALAFPVPAMADVPASAAVAADPVYDQLVVALEGSEQLRAQALEHTIDSVVRQLGESVPPIGQAMKDHPTMAGDIKEAIRGPLTAYAAGTGVILHRDMVLLFAAELPASEARDLARFYGSPLGLRLTAAAVGNYDPAQIVKDAAAGKEVQSSSVKADVYSAGLAGLRDLSAADQKAVVVFSMTPAGRHFNALMPKLLEVRARTENTPMSPEQNEALGKALTPVLDKYFGEQATK